MSPSLIEIFFCLTMTVTVFVILTDVVYSLLTVNVDTSLTFVDLPGDRYVTLTFVCFVTLVSYVLLTVILIPTLFPWFSSSHQIFPASAACNIFL